jgi:enamine deaminase RidA (YjgF/YER057c/UK114 family)
MSVPSLPATCSWFPASYRSGLTASPSKASSAQTKAALGDLSRIKRCIRLGGFVNALPDYQTVPQVINGASDLMVEVLGDAGRHARYAIGVAQLPLDAPVEVEAMFEIA